MEVERLVEVEEVEWKLTLNHLELGPIKGNLLVMIRKNEKNLIEYFYEIKTIFVRVYENPASLFLDVLFFFLR